MTPSFPSPPHHTSPGASYPSLAAMNINSICRKYKAENQCLSWIHWYLMHTWTSSHMLLIAWELFSSGYNFFLPFSPMVFMYWLQWSTMLTRHTLWNTKHTAMLLKHQNQEYQVFFNISFNQPISRSLKSDPE